MFAALVLSGCVTTSALGDFRQNGLERASFEMQCPKDQLQVQELHPHEFNGLQGGQVGVSGCNKRLVYVKTNNIMWVVNTASESQAQK
jgi:hypothetical protein